MNSKSEIVDNLILADHLIVKGLPAVKTLELIITGGASFILKGFETKVTYDIDSISKLEDDVMEYLQSFYINNAALEVTKLHPDYRNRMYELDVDFKVMKIYLLSNEDLILTKLGRSSYEDIRDIVDTGILDNTDLDLLESLANDMSQSDRDFMYKWDAFQRSGNLDR